MASKIVSDPVRVYQYCRQFLHLPAVGGMKGLGLEKDGELVAGVIYEGFNGHNVFVHIAAEPGGNWITKSFWDYCFFYPFIEMKVSRMTAYVEARNAQSIRFVEHLGFVIEAVLAGAASDGGAVRLYVMRREDCRYVDTE